MNSIKRLAVYCGSAPGAEPAFAEATRATAAAMVGRGVDLVYGGGRLGLMGLIADNVLDAGGKVYGVIPNALVNLEVAHSGVTELHTVDTMHERKAKMTDLADAFLALPGGIGTLDELFEAWSWNALGYHAKPFCLLNVDGFWDGMIDFIDHATASGFLSRAAPQPAARRREPGGSAGFAGRSRCSRYARHGLVSKRRGGAFMNQKLLGIAGILVILGIAFVLSTNRRAIRLRVVGAAFALQAAFAFFVLATPWGAAVIKACRSPSPTFWTMRQGHAVSLWAELAVQYADKVFAIAALPVIIFFASLVAILYYLGIMQRIVRWVGGAIGWVTGISRVESLCAAANIFVGQSESPLVVRPYLAALPPSRLFTVMVVGMAGVAGTILAAYAACSGAQYLPYLLAASFMSAPGGILMAKMIMPDDLPARRASARGRSDRR